MRPTGKDDIDALLKTETVPHLALWIESISVGNHLHFNVRRLWSEHYV